MTAQINFLLGSPRHMQLPLVRCWHGSTRSESFEGKNMNLKRRFILIAVSLLLAVGFLAPTAQAQDLKTGGTFIIADALSNVELDPFITSWHSWPHYAIYATLLSKDKDLNYIGYLADTWQPSEDGKTLSITLIQNAKFSDGTPVNAEAIKWNLLRFADEEVAAPIGADLVGLLEDVEVKDEFSLDLKLASAYAPLYSVLASLEIVSPTAYEKEGVDNFKRNPVGAGPFVLKAINTNTSFEFVRNPDFNWAPSENYANAGPINLDAFTIKFIEDEQTILAALEAGEIHFSGIPTQNLEEMKSNTDLTLTNVMETGIRYIGFNTSKAPWDNKDLRRAMSYAINKEEFATLAWNDQAVPLYQPLPPTIWGHNPELDAESIHYDLDKANEELDKLGYKDVDGDGIREQPDGSKWIVPFATVSGDEWVRQAEVIESQFRDAGIQIEISTMEMPAIRELTTTGTHDLFLLLYGSTEPSILRYFFDSERKGGTNRAWFSSSDLDALLAKADGDLNPDTRYVTITEISKLVMEEAPWIFLVVPNGTVGVRNEMKNWQIFPQGDFIYLNSWIEGG
jgi:peptide/nickel transport system substrate-binding protein